MIAADDLRELGGRALAAGWTPDNFWSATLGDVKMLVAGLDAARVERLEELAAHAAWVINGARQAHHAKRFKRVSPLDLFDPNRAEREAARSPEEIAEEKAVLVDQFGDLIGTRRTAPSPVENGGPDRTPAPLDPPA